MRIKSYMQLILDNLSYLFYIPIGFSGDYGDAMDLEFLKNFHRRRVKVLAEAGPDLIAFETVPNKLEAEVCKFYWFPPPSNSYMSIAESLGKHPKSQSSFLEETESDDLFHP